MAAAGYIGDWEHRDGHSFFRLELQHNGSCFAVAGGKEDAIGGQCKYTVSGSTIDIVQFEENGNFEAVPTSQPLRFKYNSSSDSISSVSDNPMTLSRTQRRQKPVD